MRAIKQSVGSYAGALFSLSSLIFLSTFGGVFFVPVVIMLLMLGFGLGGASFVYSRRGELAEVETVEDAPELSHVGLYALLALATFAALNFVLIGSTTSPEVTVQTGQVTLSLLTGPVVLATSTTAAFAGAAIFTIVLVPNAEEQFFRGLWGNLLALYFGPIAGPLFAGGIFMVFHAAIYSLFVNAGFLSTQELILFLTTSGAIFVLVDLQSEDILTSILAHMGNNAAVFFSGQQIIQVLFPGAANPIPHVVLPLAIPALLVIRRMKK